MMILLCIYLISMIGLFYILFENGGLILATDRKSFLVVFVCAFIPILNTIILLWIIGLILFLTGLHRLFK